MGRKRKIKSKRVYPYCGENPEAIVPGFCSECNCQHELPAKDWFLIKKLNGHFRMACGPSLADIVTLKIGDQLMEGTEIKG